VAANVSAEKALASVAAPARARTASASEDPPVEPCSRPASRNVSAETRTFDDEQADESTDEVMDDSTNEETDESTEEDIYEADCAFYERLGVLPEPRSFDLDCADEEEPEEPYEPDLNTTRVRSVGSLGAAYQPISAASAPSRVTREPRGRHRFNRADGLVALARMFAAGDTTRTPFEVVVTVGLDALRGTCPANDAIAVISDGACMPAETARRLACDAGIVHMTEDEHGNPLSVGRRTRSIPTSIRRALFRRDKTCRFPGCTNVLYTQGHHIEHWATGGETALRNLVRLCSLHHTYVHEYHYRVELDGNGHLRFFDDRGRLVRDVPTRIERDDLGWEHIVLANRDLEIEPHHSRWNGEPVEYSDVCRALYRLDAGEITADAILR
jgi:hypothetical protein